jgi:hypothetical protein
LVVVVAGLGPVIVTVKPANPCPFTVTVPESVQLFVQLGVTVKADPLLATLNTVTTTFPVVAPAGTGTVMLVELQLVAVPAETPLKVTVLDPCVVPKFVPVMVIGVPTGPEAGLSKVMLGGANTVRVNVCCAVAGVPWESCTSTMMFVNVPTTVGVPEISPWLLPELKPKLAGSGLDVPSRLKV